MVFSVTVFRWHQYPDLRIAAQDHIWTLNNGGVLTATLTNHGGSQTPVYIVIENGSPRLTSDPGATGGTQVVCLSSSFGHLCDPHLIFAFSNSSLFIFNGYDDL